MAQSAQDSKALGLDGPRSNRHSYSDSYQLYFKLYRCSQSPYLDRLWKDLNISTTVVDIEYRLQALD